MNPLIRKEIWRKEIWIHLKYGGFTLAALLLAFGTAIGFANVFTLWPLLIAGGVVALATAWGVVHRARSGLIGLDAQDLPPHLRDKNTLFKRK